MNTHAEYHRHMRSQEAAPTSEGANQLARLGDPSLAPAGLATPTGKRIAWVRPTDLHSYGSAAIGRGIDLHAELTRRTRRAPQTLVRSARRAVPDLTRRGPAASTSQEGLQR